MKRTRRKKSKRRERLRAERWVNKWRKEIIQKRLGERKVK